MPTEPTDVEAKVSPPDHGCTHEKRQRRTIRRIGRVPPRPGYQPRCEREREHRDGGEKRLPEGDRLGRGVEREQRAYEPDPAAGQPHQRGNDLIAGTSDSNPSDGNVRRRDQRQLQRNAPRRTCVRADRENG